MEQFFGGLAFFGLMAAQFFGVMVVAHEHRKVRASESGTSPAEDPRTRSIWLFSE